MAIIAESCLSWADHPGCIVLINVFMIFMNSLKTECHHDIHAFELPNAGIFVGLKTAITAQEMDFCPLRLVITTVIAPICCVDAWYITCVHTPAWRVCKTSVCAPAWIVPFQMVMFHAGGNAIILKVLNNPFKQHSHHLSWASRVPGVHVHRLLLEEYAHRHRGSHRWAATCCKSSSRVRRPDLKLTTFRSPF